MSSPQKMIFEGLKITSGSYVCIHMYIYIYIYGFLDFNVHQPSTGHNFYFGPDFFGLEFWGGNWDHGWVQASPIIEYNWNDLEWIRPNLTKYELNLNNVRGCMTILYTSTSLQMAVHGEDWPRAGRGAGLFWAWPGQARPIWGFLDFNVHQPSTGHNFCFGFDLLGFEFCWGGWGPWPGWSQSK